MAEQKYEDLSKVELEIECKKNSLSAKGTKAELINRLLSAENAEHKEVEKRQSPRKSPRKRTREVCSDHFYTDFFEDKENTDKNKEPKASPTKKLKKKKEEPKEEHSFSKDLTKSQKKKLSVYDFDEEDDQPAITLKAPRGSKKKDPNAPKKPTTAFLLYSKEARGEVKESDLVYFHNCKLACKSRCFSGRD